MGKKIALLMDKDWAGDYAAFLENKGHDVHVLNDPQQILEFVEKAEASYKGFEVVILHAGFNIKTKKGRLGAEKGWVDAEDLCKKIRERNQLVRIVVAGGLPPYTETKKLFKEAGADFYCQYLDLTSDWMRKQIEKGLRTPEEIEGAEGELATIPEWEVHKRWDEDREGGEGGIYGNPEHGEGMEKGA